MSVYFSRSIWGLNSIEDKLMMIAFLSVTSTKVLLKVRPHVIFIVWIDSLQPETWSACKKLACIWISFVYFFVSLILFIDSLRDFLNFRKNNDIWILRFFVYSLPVDCIVNFRSGLQRLLKTEIIMSVFQSIKAYIFELLFEKF